MTHSSAGFQDRDGFDEIRSENKLLLPVNAQSMRRELLAQDVESALHILGPFVDDVKIGISLNETTG